MRYDKDRKSLWDGVFVCRAPVSFYQKVSLDLGPQATGARIFIFFSDKHIAASKAAYESAEE